MTVPSVGTDSDGPELGRRLAVLWLDSPTWMHRRVEALRMASDGSTRLSVSLDFTLPIGLHSGGGRIYVPVGMVKKGVLRGLDTSGIGGSLPVLTRAENAILTSQMLLSLAGQAMPPGAAESRWLNLFVHLIAAGSADDARYWYRRYVAWRSTIDVPAESAILETFEGMLEGFVDNFLLVVEENPEIVGVRSIIKYSYEEDLPPFDGGKVPLNLGFTATQFGLAGSWHFEVQAPPELGIWRLTSTELDTSDGSPTGSVWSDRPTGLEGRLLAHVACRADHRFTTAEIDFVLAPLPRGLPTVTIWGALITLLVTAFGASEGLGLSALLSTSSKGSSAISVLLVGPALLLSWLSRSPEHALTARVLWPLRRMLVTSAAALLTTAVLAAVVAPTWVELPAWVMTLAFQTRAALQAAVYYRNLKSPAYTLVRGG